MFNGGRCDCFTYENNAVYVMFRTQNLVEKPSPIHVLARTVVVYVTISRARRVTTYVRNKTLSCLVARKNRNYILPAHLPEMSCLVVELPSRLGEKLTVHTCNTKLEGGCCSCGLCCHFSTMRSR